MVESETIDMIRRSVVLLVLATMVAVAACASMSEHPHRDIFDDVPAKIDPGARYLFHMHGWVVEALGPAGAVNTGYWWRWTVEAFADRGFVVISEARPHGTNVRAYALTVARQVARLRAAGVPSDHITVTGMSKGGVITVLTTATIADPNVRFVVFAGCPPSWDNGIRPGFRRPGARKGVFCRCTTGTTVTCRVVRVTSKTPRGSHSRK